MGRVQVSTAEWSCVPGTRSGPGEKAHPWGHMVELKHQKQDQSQFSEVGHTFCLALADFRPLCWTRLPPALRPPLSRILPGSYPQLTVAQTMHSEPGCFLPRVTS